MNNLSISTFSLAGSELNEIDLSSAKLNISNKTRSNLFPWNGQFSPQFIEAILRRYASAGESVLDPFCGSGTVLSESARLQLKATGIEINPAAFLMARTYTLINLDRSQRLEILSSVEAKIQEQLPSGWPLLNVLDDRSSEMHQKWLAELIFGASETERIVIEAFVILIDFYKEITVEKISRTWHRLCRIVKDLPFSAEPIRLLHSDGRYPDAREPGYDLVLTSPPYINVFNYHQQYRASAEALGWDLLDVAKAEIGSNRKNRGNRFITVIQYCLDLTICLHSLWKVTKGNARIIFVMGRESKVRGVAFLNGEIAANLALEAVGYCLAMRQERVFTNRFGQQIFEDILHFTKPAGNVPYLDYLERARMIAKSTLEQAVNPELTDEILGDLMEAIKKVDFVTTSAQYLTAQTNKKVTTISNDFPNAPPRKIERDTIQRKVAAL
jgi:16S rRNA G966 N2-methylase RsmD